MENFLFALTKRKILQNFLSNNEQKVTSNEQKAANNEQKVTSNEQRAKSFTST